MSKKHSKISLIIIFLSVSIRIYQVYLLQRPFLSTPQKKEYPDMILNYGDEAPVLENIEYSFIASYFHPDLKLYYELEFHL